MWSSAARAPLLQGSTCCALREALRHTSVVTSGYLSYCCLSLSAKQSDHSPLTSAINKAFSPRELLVTGYFNFFKPFSANPRDGCVLKFQPASLAPKTRPCSKSLKTPLLPHFDAGVELQKIVLTMSLHAQMH